MKVYSITMCYGKHQRELDKLTIKRGNLLEIRTLPIEATCRMPKTGSLNNKRIVYTANALKQLGGKLHHDNRLRILPFGGIHNIRKFKLNYKPIKAVKQNTVSTKITTKEDLTIET